MFRHRHHRPGRAMRLLLARLRGDIDAEMILVSEISGCGSCWYAVADQLADMVTAEVAAQIDEHSHMTLEGFERWFVHLIAKQLDAEDAA